MSITFKSLERHISEKNKKPKPPGRYAPGTVYIGNDFAKILKIKEDFSRTEYKSYGSKEVRCKWMIGRYYHKAKNDQEIIDVCTKIFFEGRGPVAGFESIFEDIENAELTKLVSEFNDLIKKSNYAIQDIVRITYDYFKSLPKYIDPDKLMNEIDPKVKFFS